MKKLLIILAAVIAAISTSAFASKPEATLSVQLFGDGSVTSSPAGINCPGQCTALFLKGTSITLTATLDADQTFGGWSGACAGTDPVCTLKLSADMNVSATFTGELLSGIVAVDGNDNVIGRVIGGVDITENSYHGVKYLQILTRTGYDVTISRGGARFPSMSTNFYYADSQCSGVAIATNYFPGVVYNERNRGGFFYTPKDSAAITYSYPNVYTGSVSSCTSPGADITAYPVYPNDPAITDIPNAGYTGPIRIEYR